MEILEFNNPLSSLLEICRTKQKRKFLPDEMLEKKRKKRS